jgi:hypothetical protein
MVKRMLKVEKLNLELGGLELTTLMCNRQLKKSLNFVVWNSFAW